MSVVDFIPRPRCRVPVLLAALFVAPGGCKVGPDYRPPESKPPDAWHVEATKGLRPGPADLRAWWKSLGDPTLDRLVDRAIKNNRQLLAAAARIEEVRALRGASASHLYPSIQGFGSSTFSRASTNTPTGRLTGGSHDQTHALDLDSVWEIDLFGGLRRNVESADASLEATVEDYRDVLVVLLAEVARTYVDVRTIQERLVRAEANVKVQEESLRLAQARFETELASELDPHQAKLNLANTESVIPTLRIALRQSIDRMAVLLGEYPAGLIEELSRAAPIPKAPPALDVSPPAEVLRQRPDIRRAERELAAQTARIGVATADLYPRFFLGGDLALQARDPGNLFDASRSHTYGLGPSFRWNLFSGGLVRNAIRAEEARTREALLAWEGTVLAAVGEVEDALIAYAREGDRLEALGRSVDEARRSVDLVMASYEAGLTDFQNVLDMQRSLFQQEDSLAQSRGKVIQDLIAVYKAMGGGWSAAGPEEPRKAAPDPASPPSSVAARS